jgi:peptidyl-prolyl cis-trans isomerase SurA
MTTTCQISRGDCLMDKSLTGKRRMSAPVWHLLAVLFSFLLIHNISARQINDDILLAVDNREISAAEFMHHWEKSDFYPDPGMMQEYLELFIDFQLKVSHAREEGIHREASVINALAQHRRNLAVPYLGDPDMEEKLAREAYGRLLYDINASHILVRLAPGYSPDDTLMAWDKAMQIRESILDGEPFEIIARATSDDPSAKLNSGNLGYFTALQMLYPFENAVFAAEPGEIGMPVRSRSGYHIIRVNERRKSRGEIKAAHIMIGYNQYDMQEAEKKAGDVYKSLLAGQSFEDLAAGHSTDFTNAGQGGVMDWFGAGRFVPEFEAAAFALQKPGDISEPVRTSYGWHIIKLIDQREIPPLTRYGNNCLTEYGNRGAAVTRL